MTCRHLNPSTKIFQVRGQVKASLFKRFLNICIWILFTRLFRERDMLYFFILFFNYHCLSFLSDLTRINKIITSEEQGERAEGKRILWSSQSALRTIGMKILILSILQEFSWSRNLVPISGLCSIWFFSHREQISYCCAQSRDSNSPSG